MSFCYFFFKFSLFNAFCLYLSNNFIITYIINNVNELHYALLSAPNSDKITKSVCSYFYKIFSFRKCISNMYQYMTSKQLKDSARHRLSIAGSAPIAATALLFGIIFLVSAGITLFTMDATTLEVSPLYYVGSFLLALITNILFGGFSYMMLKMYCGHPIGLGDLFYAFTKKGKKLLLVSAILGVITYVLELPIDILSTRFAESFSMYDGALFFFATAICMTIIVIIDILYALVSYLAIDYPGYSTFRIFSMSAHLMKGHKARFFYIMVSFLPMLLLSCITCGILFLWILPLMQAVCTEFYLDIVTHK